MQQDTSTQITNPEQSAYVTLLTVQCEIGITRGTLKKYLTYLGLEPICFHIGTRSLYISRKAMTLMQHLKQHPAPLAHLPFPLLPLASEERETGGDEKRKDTSDAL
ncbi:MAG: hypothetical protein NVSMB27_13500 [Ktedonobacteraceae bacterium]